MICKECERSIHSVEHPDPFMTEAHMYGYHMVCWMNISEFRKFFIMRKKRV